MSREIVALLQHPRAARDLMAAVLKARSTPGEHSITVTSGNKVTRYKPVTAIHRGKSA